MNTREIIQKIREWKVLREVNRQLLQDDQISSLIHEKMDRLSVKFEIARQKAFCKPWYGIPHTLHVNQLESDRTRYYDICRN